MPISSRHNNRNDCDQIFDLLQAKKDHKKQIELEKEQKVLTEIEN